MASRRSSNMEAIGRHSEAASETGREPADNLRRRATKNFAMKPSQPHQEFEFKPFTKESLNKIQLRKTLDRKRSMSLNPNQLELNRAEQLAKPDPFLVSGQQIPPAFIRRLPKELVGKPIEDIDPYYANKDTFIIINRGRELIRFSASKALFLFGPFHPIRRTVLYILVHPIFNCLVIMTILINCVFMAISDDSQDKFETLFTAAYTTEMLLKIIARGFTVGQFTYLRDVWNWIDFFVIATAYWDIVNPFSNNNNNSGYSASAIRTFRVLRALKTVAIIPGMKTIVGAVIDSVKNLKDVVVLTLFSLSVFSLLGLQLYMSTLSQKCVKNPPGQCKSDTEWYNWVNNKSNWLEVNGTDSPFHVYRLCGNSSGSQTCGPDYTCLQVGPNPENNYTSFDNFGLSLICSFRLMTQDFWEGLFSQVLKTAGYWHLLYFLLSIFLGSIYLMNLILAIVAMSYNALQRRAEAEEEARAEEEEAFLNHCLMLEEMSVASTCGARSSYRPSVELGLLGRSLVANLCEGPLFPDSRGAESSDQQGRSHSFSHALQDRQVALSRDTTKRASCQQASINLSPTTCMEPRSSRSSHGNVPRPLRRLSSNIRHSSGRISSSARPSMVAGTGRELARLREHAAQIKIVSDDCSNDLESIDQPAQQLQPLTTSLAIAPPRHSNTIAARRKASAAESCSATGNGHFAGPLGASSLQNLGPEPSRFLRVATSAERTKSEDMGQPGKEGGPICRQPGLTSGSWLALGLTSDTSGPTQRLESPSERSKSASTSPPFTEHNRLRLGVRRSSKMHYLSVENFNQFSWIEPRSASGRQSQQEQHQPQPLAGSSTSAVDQEEVAVALNSLKDARRRSRLEVRPHIHPSILARASVCLGPSTSGSPRRVSQHLVRRASDWSRQSGTVGVDVRRMLKLWAHTNPYQGHSDYSLSNSSNGRLPPVYDMSSRPSSVGSTRQSYQLVSAMTRRYNDHYECDADYDLPLDDNLLDQVSISGRDKCIANCLSCLDVICIWECCGPWVTIKRINALIIFDPFTELFITFCILMNTLFMALDSEDIEDAEKQRLENFLETGNSFFTLIFSLEAVMKIIALSPKFYFQEGWNVFDSVIVALSLLEMILEGVHGLSVLRTFRLLRVFKLAKSWPTLNLLISIMGKAVGDLGNLTFVLAIIVFIFAVTGMQIFGKNYTVSCFNTTRKQPDVPRWNFKDFMHSFMIVFRILCAEWIEPMWDCMETKSILCIPFFLTSVTVGNLVVLNLFLALLLASFEASNLASPQVDNVDTRRLREAIDRFRRLGRWLKRKTVQVWQRFTHCLRCGLRSKKEQVYGSRRVDKPSCIVELSQAETHRSIERRTEELKNRIMTKHHDQHHHHLSHLARSQMRRANCTLYSYEDKNYTSTYNENTPIPVSAIPIIVDELTETEGGPDEAGTTMKSCVTVVGSPDSPTRSLKTILAAPIMQTIEEDSTSIAESNKRERGAKSQQQPPNLATMRWRNLKDKVVAQNQLENATGPAETFRASALCMRAPHRIDMIEEDNEALRNIDAYIENCLCMGVVCLKWFLARQWARKIVEHKYFDHCILLVIVISSGSLALEDKNTKSNKEYMQWLGILDAAFTVIFTLEMILRWMAFGLKRYFGNIWSWLDFIIVVVSLINIMAALLEREKSQALKSFRTLRAMRGLRPLRALQRFQGMRVVVNALIQAIPSIFNVLLVCLIFWLIFSIMGVQMFGGKFARCIDTRTGELINLNDFFYSWDNSSEHNKECNKSIDAIKLEAQTKGLKGGLDHKDNCTTVMKCSDNIVKWDNPPINFDNVPNAYLALFQVATFKGWIDIMERAVDSRGKGYQPSFEANLYMYFYFVFFVIFGSFFTLNLFIGVIIDNFNEQKRKTGGSLEIFMTEDQKKYYNAMKKMRSKRPIKAMTRPNTRVQGYVFDLITSRNFDMAIMTAIVLNMFVMALEHRDQSAEFAATLESLNLVFIAIFTLECLCKMFAMRHFYFREPWNIFDFVVVSLSIIGVLMKEYVSKYFVSPTLLRVVRVVKVGRVLRLVRGAKGIRTLLFALAMSLPALFNICLLLFLVMFIYAIFGMTFFMNVEHKYGGIDDTFNFDTFMNSMIVLFEMSTSAGWDLILKDLMTASKCDTSDPSKRTETYCGNKLIAVLYLVSYVIVTFLIIINMYIAVILENYSQATEDVQEGLTDDDYEMYYEIWQKFDPQGTQFLAYNRLSDFVDELEDPLRIPKPNKFTLVLMDLNIYEGNKCNCYDILDALTKYFFTKKGLDIKVDEQLQKIQSTLHEPSIQKPMDRITSTLMLQRENYCASIIQNCWRRWRESRRQNFA